MVNIGHPCSHQYTFGCFMVGSDLELLLFLWLKLNVVYVSNNVEPIFASVLVDAASSFMDWAIFHLWHYKNPFIFALNWLHIKDWFDLDLPPIHIYFPKLIFIHLSSLIIFSPPTQKHITPIQELNLLVWTVCWFVTSLHGLRLAGACSRAPNTLVSPSVGLSSLTLRDYYEA